MVPVVILNDGETFTDANNCRLTLLKDGDSIEEIEENLRNDDEVVLANIRQRGKWVYLELTEAGTRHLVITEPIPGLT